MSHSVFLLDPTPVDVTNFLAYLFMKGASHNAINTAGSALSAFLSPHQNGLSIGSRPEVCRILKGVFERRPALPRYSHTWDVDMVLDYLAGVELLGGNAGHGGHVAQRLDPPNDVIVDTSHWTERKGIALFES